MDGGPGFTPGIYPLQAFNDPPQLEYVAGDLQTIQVFEVTALGLKVRCTDSTGQPLPGVRIKYTVTSGAIKLYHGVVYPGEA
jgi:hypothetical protein